MQISHLAIAFASCPFRHSEFRPIIQYAGPALIHCTPVTASLLIHVHHVPSMYVVEHEYGSTWTYRIPPRMIGAQGGGPFITDGPDEHHHPRQPRARITFYDANHCPGACIVVIQLTKVETAAGSPSSSLYGTGGVSKVIRGTATTTTVTHVHTGDIRYDAQKFHSYPLLQEAVQRNEIDVVYLDTTYSHPKHQFCPQAEAVEAIAQQTEELLSSSSLASSVASNDGGDRNTGDQPARQHTHHPRTLVLLSCYSIGKEKVLWEASRRTNQLVYVTDKKYRMLQCIQPRKETQSDYKNDEGDDALSESHIIERCTRDPWSSDLHVIPMGLAGELWPFFRPKFQKCAQYALDLEERMETPLGEAGAIDDEILVQTSPQHIPHEPQLQTPVTTTSTSSRTKPRYDRVVAFIPTGWANGSNWNKRNATSTKEVTLSTGRTIRVEIRLISYSEHSAYHELVSFVEYLKPRKVIPTVFADDADYRKIQSRFCMLLDSTRAKQAFLGSMRVGTAPLRPFLTTSSSSSSRDSSVPDKTKVDDHEAAGDELLSEGPASKIIDIDTNLETMVSMGFDREQAKSCLEQSDGNMENAIDKLLSSYPTIFEAGSDPGGSMSTRIRQGSVVIDISNVADDRTPTIDALGTPQVTKRKREMAPPSSGQITNFFPRKKAGS